MSSNPRTDSGTPQENFFYPGQPVTNVVPAYEAALGQNGMTNAESLINLPPSNVRAPQEIAYYPTNLAYDFNSASLIVSNWYWGSNGVVPWSNNFTVYVQDRLTPFSSLRSNGISVNWIQLTNDYYIISNRYSFAGYTLYITNYVPNFQFTNNVSSICWTNNVAANGPLGTNSVWYAGFTFLTNATFYDYREQATVRAVQLNVGKLRTWITNAAVNGGNNWNQDLSEDLGQGIDSVFIYNAIPFIGQQQLPAVQVTNGMLLPPGGLTLVTPQPMYVIGSYNVATTNHSAVLASHNTAYTYPAALMADAITILSSNWQNSYNASTSLSSRTPCPTTINAACLQGIVPSSGNNYSGGVENYFRLLENWFGSLTPLTYNGSFVVMFSSIYATNLLGGDGSYYDVPFRDWAFDTNFTSLAGLPPLTWLLVNSNSVPMITAEPTNSTVLVGQTTNFTVGIAGLPAPAYQWSFQGTNISGATNALLPLADIQLTNAGDYSVDVTNVFGSVISSNALLSVYTSAVPVLNALSFSPSSGAGFTVSGVPGFSYEVLASSNLVNWIPLVTSNSPFIFDDTNTVLPQRFYRGVYVP